ncbi:MAG: tetratricopeptide repeat protein [Myxococcales bacterium]|nr:tetratricopeptide repeat protein [Myxococcales bacterium]
MTRREIEADDAEGYGEASRYTAHIDRGWSLLDRGDFQHARNSAHQAQRLRPDVPDAAMLMAAISLAEGDADGSLEWYERAIEADAEYVDAQLAAAQLLLYDLDDPQRALARAEQARELDELGQPGRADVRALEHQQPQLGQEPQHVQAAITEARAVADELVDGQVADELRADVVEAGAAPLEVMQGVEALDLVQREVADVGVDDGQALEGLGLADQDHGLVIRPGPLDPQLAKVAEHGDDLHHRAGLAELAQGHRLR